MTFFNELQQTIQKFIWNNKRPRIAKAILRNKYQAGAITLPDFKNITKPQSSKQSGTGIKTDRQTDQRSRTENPEINPDTYGQLNFDKGGKSIKWEK